MTDREMLLLLYGAVKAVTDEDDKLYHALQMLEDHLFPNPNEELSAERSDEGRPAPLPVSSRGDL